MVIQRKIRFATHAHFFSDTLVDQTVAQSDVSLDPKCLRTGIFLFSGIAAANVRLLIQKHFIFQFLENIERKFVDIDFNVTLQCSTKVGVSMLRFKMHDMSRFYTELDSLEKAARVDFEKICSLLALENSDFKELAT